jgi:hypothetical protein
MKLLTPIARTRPSASRVSSALYAAMVFSNRSGQRLVQDEQVEVVDAELGHRFLPGVQGLVVAVVADPDLGLDEHVRTVDAGTADALADLPLVAVRGGGVDVPVAGRQRGLDRRRRLLGGFGRRPARGRAS